MPAALIPVWKGVVPVVSYHLCLNVRNCIRTGDYRNWVGSVTHEGKPLTADEILDGLLDEIAKGHRVIPLGKGCDNFDFVNGCQGHEQE